MFKIFFTRSYHVGEESTAAWKKYELSIFRNVGSSYNDHIHILLSFFKVFCFMGEKEARVIEHEIILKINYIIFIHFHIF